MQQSEWCGLYVKPRFERVASFHLQSHNVEHYLPLRRVTRESAGAIRSIELPVFPGYVFCKADAPIIRSMLIIPGVICVIGDAIPDQKVSDLKRIIEAGLSVEHCSFPPLGKAVTIENGDLKGISGVLRRTPNDVQIFILSIEAISRSISVRINPQYTFASSAGTAA